MLREKSTLVKRLEILLSKEIQRNYLQGGKTKTDEKR